MRLPTPLYESLPYLYFIGAILCVVLLHSPITLFSALLLTFAGWMVWRMRKNYRSYNRENILE